MMHKIIFNFLVLSALLNLFQPAFSSTVCPKPWRVAVSDRYPFESFKDGKAQGLNVDIINRVAKKLNCKIDFLDLPFARIMYEAKSGKVDIVMAIGKRKEREEFGYYFAPYLNSPSVIIIFKEKGNNFTNFNLADLTQTEYKYKIAGLIGAIYSKDYEKFLADPIFVKHLVLTPKNSTNMLKLLRKEVDAILISDIAVAKNLMKSSGFEKNLQMIPIDKEDYSYFMYSKKTFSEEQAKTINLELVSLLNEKEAEALMLKYFSKEELKIFK